MEAQIFISEQDRDRAAEIGAAALEAFYGSRSNDLECDAEFLRGHFNRLLRRAGYSLLSVEARPKKRSSAISKIRRKCADKDSEYGSRILRGDAPEKILTDLVGIRITCKFSDQIDEVASVIRREFTLRDSECVDHRKPNDYGKFGYAALHLIAEPINATITNVYYSGCAFEIQIRSALMDIWSIVNWDISYTDERDTPYELLRRMSTLSALLYLVDEEFIRIRDSISLAQNSGNNVIDNPVREILLLSSDVISKLAKRGITFSQEEWERIKECGNLARNYRTQIVELDPPMQSGALALYLFDKDRFAWILHENAAKMINEFDRKKG